MKKRDNTAVILLSLAVGGLALAVVVAVVVTSGGSLGFDPAWQFKTHEQKKAAYKKKVEDELRAFKEGAEEAMFGPPEKQVADLEKQLADFEELQRRSNERGIPPDAGFDASLNNIRKRLAEQRQKLKAKK